jgi:AcrR family transcriptional regulator
MTDTGHSSKTVRKHFKAKMTRERTDRRVNRTTQLLQRAHIDLILSKGYGEMTVQDICDAANVGRSTFYAHFRGKDDLRRSGFKQLRRLLAERQASALASNPDGPGRSFAFGLALFSHAHEHIHLYRALMGTRGGEIGLNTIRAILRGLVCAELEAVATGPRSPMQTELVVQFVVGAYMAVLTWWLDTGAKLPPEEVDAMVRPITTAAIHASTPSNVET